MDNDTQDAAERIDLDGDETTFVEIKAFVDRRGKKAKARKNLKKPTNANKMDTSNLDDGQKNTDEKYSNTEDQANELNATIAAGKGSFQELRGRGAFR